MSVSYPPVSVSQGPRGGLFVRERAPASPRGTVILLHGLGESALCFEALLREPRLAAWRLVAPDLPGYGKSAWPEQPIDFAETVDRLEAWMMALALPPAVIVGHSMGGVLGADLARQAPERVRAFVNVEGNITLDDCTLSADAEAYSVDAFLNRGHATLIDGIAEQGRNDRALRGYHVSLRLCDPRQLHRDAVELVARSRAGGLAGETAAVDAPVIYVLGDPRGTGAASRARLDQAGVAWRAISPAGHWPYLDQHDAFVTLLTTFLDRYGALS